MLIEFKKFVTRGNVLDLAVGVIIGGAFGKIVSSLVNDLIMPIVGLVLGGRTNFTDFFVPLNGQAYASLQAARDAGAPVFAYGSFITTLLDFFIVAFIIFMAIRLANKMKQPEVPPASPVPPPPSKEEVLLAEIRDLLKQQSK